MRSRTWMAIAMIGLVAGLTIGGLRAYGQESAPAAAPAAAAAPAKAAAAAPAKAAAEAVPAGATVEGDEKAAPAASSNSFKAIIFGSGWMGVMLWVGLLVCSLAAVYLIIDAFVKISQKKIAPPELIAKVRESMEHGDLGQALEHCKKSPGPLANILTAGFSNVEEGFDVIQESISATADLESEKLLQRVTYLSVVSNLAPLLGLAGTVQGMIMAFDFLATQTAGAAQQSMLALAISQALYTTIAGLAVAIPGTFFYFVFRNRANNIILGMVIATTDLIKVLRNVEVVAE